MAIIPLNTLPEKWQVLAPLLDDGLFVIEYYGKDDTRTFEIKTPLGVTFEIKTRQGQVIQCPSNYTFTGWTGAQFNEWLKSKGATIKEIDL